MPLYLDQEAEDTGTYFPVVKFRRKSGKKATPKHEKTIGEGKATGSRGMYGEIAWRDIEAEAKQIW